MKAFRWGKHSITILTFVFLILGVVTVFNLDVETETFGANILSSTFFLFLFAISAVYRIGCIGRNTVDWIGTSLAVLTATIVTIMWLAPQNVMALWKPTLALYILLIGYTFFRRIKGEHWSGRLTRILLIANCVLLLYPLLIKTGSPFYYTISSYILIATFMVAVTNVLLTSRK